MDIPFVVPLLIKALNENYRESFKPVNESSKI